MRENAGDGEALREGADVLGACERGEGLLQDTEAGDDGEAVDVALEVADLTGRDLARGRCGWVARGEH